MRIEDPLGDFPLDGPPRGARDFGLDDGSQEEFLGREEDLGVALAVTH